MSQSINELERDIEQTRARLDSTIDQLQSRLSTSGIVDEVLGTVRRTQFASVMDDTLEAVRRNPVPVLLVAAGLGLLFYRMTERSQARRRRPLDPYDDGVPVLRPRGARVYDPDVAAAYPTADTLPPRRANDARA
jgi:ElaB/YqjD/DUF883 family membrane-anchored ribosome-binding protein